jgi:hypothetical protein
VHSELSHHIVLALTISASVALILSSIRILGPKAPRGAALLAWIGLALSWGVVAVDAWKGLHG